MRFNLNEYVRVQLTERGRAIYAANIATLNAQTGAHLKVNLPAEDADGWSKWQLWELMREFGPHIYMGCEPPFHLEIEIPEPAPL